MNYSDTHKPDSLRTGDDLLARLDELTREFASVDEYERGVNGWRPLLWAAKRDIERLIDAYAEALGFVAQARALLGAMYDES